MRLYLFFFSSVDFRWVLLFDGVDIESQSKLTMSEIFAGVGGKGKTSK